MDLGMPFLAAGAQTEGWGGYGAYAVLYLGALALIFIVAPLVTVIYLALTLNGESETREQRIARIHGDD